LLRSGRPIDMRSLAGPRWPLIAALLLALSACAESAERSDQEPAPSSMPTTGVVPTKSPPDTREPAEGRVPVHGICSGPTRDSLATVAVNPDTPAPICTLVAPDQRLRVFNGTDRFGFTGGAVTVRFAGLAPRRVPVGGSTTYGRSFQELIQPGVHRVRFAWNHRSYDAELLLCPRHSRLRTC